MGNLTRAEQETIINLTADQPDAEIYTCDPVWIRRLEKLHERRPDLFRMVRCTADSVEYRCPKKCVKVLPPRVLSEEQRQASARRLAALRTPETKEGGTV